jgi:hypothetical protein
MENDGISKKPRKVVVNIPVAKMENIYHYDVKKPKGVSDLDQQKVVLETEFGTGNNSNPASVSNGNVRLCSLSFL